jgi:NAD(P)-dependent dehydrogenase (short-subunit alcohol dehydrogenase family)
MKNIIVISGASSGFGALAARALARAGHAVYASMRETTGRNAPQVKEAEKYAAEHKVDLRAIEMDVASQESCDSTIRQIIAKDGRLDVIIHNAGHMVFGPAEAFTPEQLAELYNVNVLSTQRVNRAALPQLRKQRNGLVVWILQQQRNWRDSSLSRTLFRGKGRHGCFGRSLRARISASGH